MIANCMRLLPAMLGAFVSALPPAPAAAQDTRPLRVIVATGVGGTADVFMRVLGENIIAATAARSWWKTAPAAA